MVAGQLIEEVSGETWEHYVRQHVFGPVGMNNSTDSVRRDLANPNHACPHGRIGGPIRGLGPQTLLDENATIAPERSAGGRARDQRQRHERWLLDAARPRQDPGRRQAPVLAKSNPPRCGAGVVIRRRSASSRPSSQPPSRISTLYALGWDVSEYRGAKVIWPRRRGARLAATVALLPEKNIGIFIAVKARTARSSSV